MGKNPAEMAQVENAGKARVSVEKRSALIDRRISVAPMMDWTDAAKTLFSIKCLDTAKNACLLYVSSILRASRFRPAPFAGLGAAE